MDETTPTIPETASPKKHLILKIVLWAIALIVIIAIALFYTPRVLGLIYQDSAPVNDADLQLGTVHVPDAQNLYFDLPALASSTDAAAAMHAAAQKAHYQNPSESDAAGININTPIPSLNALRNAAVSASRDAVATATAGHPDAGLQEALDVASVGNRMENSQSSTIEWLVGVAIENSGLRAIQQIATSTHPSPERILAASNSLRAFTNGEAGLVNAIKTEYALHKASVIDVSNTSGNRPIYYWHPNETIGYFADDARNSITLAQQSCSTPVPSGTYKHIPAPKNVVVMYFTENAIGKILHSVMFATLGQLKTKECATETLLDTTRNVLVSASATK